jgi:hypothetical protein
MIRRTGEDRADRHWATKMNATRTRLAVAELTATLTTDFDLPTFLNMVAEHARTGFDAYSAVVILLDHRHTMGEAGIQIVAEALREHIDADLSFHTAGPGLVSARDGAVTMIDDLADAHDTRWPKYRERAGAAGMRGVRAFPVTALGAPLGSLVVHTDEPWGQLRPNDFGQVLANLTAIALSDGASDTRRVGTANTVETVLQGTIVINTATGIVAQTLGLSVGEARLRLIRLARAHGVTVTEHARAIVDAQNDQPSNPGALGVFEPPPDLTPPRHIDT